MDTPASCIWLLVRRHHQNVKTKQDSLVLWLFLFVYSPQFLHGARVYNYAADNSFKVFRNSRLWGWLIMTMRFAQLACLNHLLPLFGLKCLTPLAVALTSGSIECTDVLLAQNCREDFVDLHGASLIHMAASGGRVWDKCVVDLSSYQYIAGNRCIEGRLYVLLPLTLAQIYLLW